MNIGFPALAVTVKIAFMAAIYPSRSMKMSVKSIGPILENGPT
jgi:hypothetical protein